MKAMIEIYFLGYGWVKADGWGYDIDIGKNPRFVLGTATMEYSTKWSARRGA